MKRVAAVINAGALFLFLGMLAPAYAQDQAEHPKADQHAQEQQKHVDQKQQEHARKEQEKSQKEAQKRQKSEQRQQEKQAKDQQQRQEKQAKEQQQRQEKQAQVQQGHQEKQAKEQRTREQHDRMAQNNDHPNKNDNRADRNDNHHDRGQMEARNHERIPEDRYREHFGHEHEFHVHRVVEVEGHPRFQYSGYWFELVNPWPMEWSYDDDCYITYMDGDYWLLDPVHPGVQIQVFVVG